MEHHLTAFVGIDCYDLLLYSSKILTQLEYKVLLVDASFSGALTCCMSIPEEQKQELLFSETSDENYMVQDEVGFDFIRSANEQQIQGMKLNYDYVFVSCGFTLSEEFAQLCDQIILCTDQQLHNIHRIGRIKGFKEHNTYLLYKTQEGYQMSSAYLLSRWKLSIIKEHIYEYVMEERDISLQLDCQHSAIVTFRGLSKSMKDCVKMIFQWLGVWESKRTMRRAYRIASHGGFLV